MIVESPCHPSPRQRLLRRAIPVIATVVFLFPVLLAPSPATATSYDDVVTAAYQGLLGRSPDAAGLAFWTSELDRGLTPSEVVERIGDADEQRRNVVRETYRAVLGRAPDPAGLAFWSAGIIDRLTARSLQSQIFGSDEFFSRAGSTNTGFVDQLYQKVLNRGADGPGLEYWLDQLNDGANRINIAQLFLESNEGLLQPDLSIVAASPGFGAVTRSVATITVELDRAVLGSSSAIIVAVGGVRVRGATTSVPDDPNSLRFTATESVQGLAFGSDSVGVVTVFAYDGTTMDRVDYGFTYRHDATSLNPSNELMVAFYGHPRAAVLGVAGEGTPEQVLPRLLDQAAPYAASGKKIVPTWELIATLVTGAPGPDNLYRARLNDADVRPYLDNIRTVGGRVILDIQPGRADVLDEARAFESLLIEPDVGLAIDPEWVVGPTQTPAGRIGTLDAADINRVSAYLSDLVLANDLPPKVMIVHRFNPGMVTNSDAILDRPGLRILFHADGEGGPGAKIGDYDNLLPNRFERGIKIFYDEDVNMMSPAEVLHRLAPDPTFVSYQ